MKRWKRGLLLIELVMVTIILGILAVAVPKMTKVLNQATVRAELVVVDQIWAGESYASDKLLETGNESYHLIR